MLNLRMTYGKCIMCLFGLTYLSLSTGLFEHAT